MLLPPYALGSGPILFSHNKNPGIERAISGAGAAIKPFLQKISTLGAGVDGAAHGLMSRRIERPTFVAGADGAAGAGRCGVL